MPGVLKALAAALFLAAVNTLGDFVWARWVAHHRAVYGLLHGAALCLALGLALGAARGRPARGALAGPAIGLGAAAGYYALATVMGYAAMFVMWMVLWMAFGLFGARGLGEPRASTAEALVRGALAAVGSGVGFYAISGIWTRHGPGPPDYAYNFLCWTVAFLPGFLALLAGRAAAPAPRP
jgi:hypothetical protein